MNQYLAPDENREAIVGHNEQLVVTTTKTVGKSTYTSHDFNREEEFRQLDAALTGDLDSLTVREIASSVYGADDDDLVKRVRSSLRFGSPYQKTMRNGTAVIARQDGSLRVTRSADEFGDLVEENTANAVAKLGKYMKRATIQLDKSLAGAVDKVPELRDRLTETRNQAGATLSTVFAHQLELLSGLD